MTTVTHGSRAVHGGGLTVHFTRLVDAIARTRASRRAARHLMRLDDHLLADVGLTRDDVRDLYHR